MTRMAGKLSKHYAVDEFILDTPNAYAIYHEDTDDCAEKKVSLLHDFGILGKEDYRESAVRAMLKECKTEQQMTKLLHDVLMDRKSLNELLAERGFGYAS